LIASVIARSIENDRSQLGDPLRGGAFDLARRLAAQHVDRRRFMSIAR
jgi:hypothetical protein